MPAEIADSDAESDCISPQRPPVSPIVTPDIETRQLDPSQPDPVLDLQFSQFLSPTQRLSSAVQQQEESHPHSSGSTDRFLRDIHNTEGRHGTSIAASLDNSVIEDTGPSVRHKPKRRFSDIEHSTSSPLDGDSTQRKLSRKAKTYGSSRSMRENPPSSLFEQDSASVNGDQHDLVSAATAGGECDPYPVPVHIESNGLSSPEQPARETHQQSNWSINPLQSNGNNQITRDGMHSGYHGMTLDFRNGNAGLDINANPFGSLSQISFDGDIDSMEVQRFTNLFTGQRNDTSLTGSRAEMLHAPEYDANAPIRHSTSADGAKTDLRTTSTQNIPQPLDLGASEVPVFTPNPGDVNDHHVIDVNTVPEEDTIVLSKETKKRGRKPKNKKTDHERKREDVSMVDDHVSSNGGNEMNGQTSVARADCGDGENAQSDTSNHSKSAKRRKKGAGKSKLADASPVRNISSELGLNDPNLVGMPKEVYLAKPSRSRSRRQVEEQEQIETNSRPPADQSLLSMVDNDLDDRGIETIQTAKRKSKTKRSKQSTTSGGGNAKHDTMNEKNVRIDEEPVDIPAKTTSEDNDSGQQSDQEDTKKMVISTNRNEIPVEDVSECKETPTLSVDIPPFPKSPEPHGDSSKSRSKKRGRKPKKEIPKIVDDEPIQQPNPAEDDTKEGEEMHAASRPALEEMDPNLVATSADTGLPKSPLSRAASDADVQDRDDENNSENHISASKVSIGPTKDKVSQQKSSSSTLNAHSSSSSSANLFNQKSRIGLSRKMHIPSLLRKLDRTREPPKVHERKEKLTKKQQEAEDKRRLEAEDGGDNSGTGMWSERGVDGMLIEWND